MGGFASFLELELKNGQLLAVLGSGPWQEVVRRKVPGPFVRICMADQEALGCRVQLGTAKLTDSGLKYADRDEHQLRGASIQLFARAPAIASQLGKQGKLLRTLIPQFTSGWLKCGNGRIVDIAERFVHEDLARGATPLEQYAYIQFKVPPERGEEILTLLALMRED